MANTAVRGIYERPPGVPWTWSDYLSYAYTSFAVGLRLQWIETIAGLAQWWFGNSLAAMAQEMAGAVAGTDQLTASEQKMVEQAMAG